MSILVKGSEFVPAPEGVCDAVCVDVADLGMIDGPWGAKHKVRIVWEVSHKMADGRPFVVQKQYTASLHEKSNLSKDLRSWRGRPFTADELNGFDVEKVLGACCQLLIQHTEKEGAVYGNVQAILKVGAHRLAPTGKYVRFKDRPESPNGKPANAGSGDDGGDSDIPF